MKKGLLPQGLPALLLAMLAITLIFLDQKKGYAADGDLYHWAQPACFSLTSKKVGNYHFYVAIQNNCPDDVVFGPGGVDNMSDTSVILPKKLTLLTKENPDGIEIITGVPDARELGSKEKEQQKNAIDCSENPPKNSVCRTFVVGKGSSMKFDISTDALDIAAHFRSYPYDWNQLLTLLHVKSYPPDLYFSSVPRTWDQFLDFLEVKSVPAALHFRIGVECDYNHSPL